MLKDYLIVVMLTVVAGWKISLPILGILIFWCWRRRHIVWGVLFGAGFLWTALAAWQFEKYL
ncbi:hypothetical protein GIX45_14005 [Erwinia sp. CPCC 100877]|nr:hypothetical protein [Erwinia sp. CPCC 100877]